jgi:hypothetical protein
MFDLHAKDLPDKEIRNMNSDSFGFLSGRISSMDLRFVFRSRRKMMSRKQITQKEVAQEMQQDHEDQQEGRDSEVRDRLPNLEPRADIIHQEEEVEAHQVGDGQAGHKQGEFGQPESGVQSAKDGRDDQEGDQDLEEQQRRHQERAEDRDQSVDRLEIKRRDGPHVPRPKKPHMDEK